MTQNRRLKCKRKSIEGGLKQPNQPNSVCFREFALPAQIKESLRCPNAHSSFQIVILAVMKIGR